MSITTEILEPQQKVFHKMLFKAKKNQTSLYLPVICDWQIVATQAKFFINPAKQNQLNQ